MQLQRRVPRARRIGDGRWYRKFVWVGFAPTWMNAPRQWILFRYIWVHEQWESRAFSERSPGSINVHQHGAAEPDGHWIVTLTQLERPWNLAPGDEGKILPPKPLEDWVVGNARGSKGIANG